ncbi:T-cell leukemia translocation-altered gene protein homolog isoform X3 [Hypanus sabinus]|uniref:T-cell leukemia translocation-altered gene protein homolog isoform X3 n=1 Tax=Hypanus sabinus TaxID=79690 RepID=UPI0028C48F2F|nr:T-cell leukemia translocation-altered gene protein homolog isoform X3 [Hypanus sabinus]
MELPRDLGWFSGLLESVVSFCSEFAQDWSTNDMRVTIFKILLGWLVCSLVAIHMAWKYHGATVNDMYYREWRSEWWYSRWILKLYSLGRCKWQVNEKSQRIAVKMLKRLIGNAVSKW